MKETKKAKPTNVKRSEKDGKPYQDNYGNYYFNVTLDNGDEGLYATNKDIQTKFVVGQEVEYELEKKVSEKGKEWFKITLPKPEYKGGGKGGWQPKTTKEAKRDIVSMTMRYTVDLWTADKINRGQVQEIHKELTQYVWDIMDELESDGGEK